jgi:hypothetical protein
VADSRTSHLRAQHRVGMEVLDDVLRPEVLHEAVPRLSEVAEARVAHKNLMNTVQKLGAYTRATGYDSTRSLQYVAQIDQSVWSAVLEVFGDDLFPHGQPMNRLLFYALLDGPLQAYDMRGKIVL